MSLKFITKNVAVYEALRKDIIEGRLKPGQKIIMSEVAKEFGLSDIPVREAIRDRGLQWRGAATSGSDPCWHWRCWCSQRTARSA